jgi:hypothetical protein
MKKVLTAAGIGAALALAGAGVANAYSDETYFLDLQVAHGWIIWDPGQHVRAAHWTCDRLNYETGDYVLPELASLNPGSTYAENTQFLWDAITALCPWHDHRGEGGGGGYLA